MKKKRILSDYRNEMGDKKIIINVFWNTSPLTLEEVTVETQWVVKKLKGMKKWLINAYVQVTIVKNGWPIWLKWITNVCLE